MRRLPCRKSSKNRLLFVALFAAFCLPLAPRLQADMVPQPQTGNVDNRSLELFAVGDWGIDSPDRQKVADAMANTVSPEHHPAAVLLLGDNYYVDLTDLTDPRIQTFFEKTYDPVRLNVPFYAVLGNHDYKGDNAAIELACAAQGHTRFTMPSRWYRLDLPADHPLATIVMLDSDKDTMAPSSWDAQTAWGSLFLKYNVAVYLCGHEHTHQHLEIPGWSTSFVIDGCGGAERKPMLKDKRGPFSRASLGFADLQFAKDAVTISLFDGSAKIVQAFSRTLDGNITLLQNGASDRATRHPLAVINGIDIPEPSPTMALSPQ